MASGFFILATVCTVLLTQVAAFNGNWPSLRFHFTIKRSSMQLHGQSDFSMLDVPVVNKDSKVLYDTSVTFTEDSTLYNYTVVDGVAYVSDSIGVDCDDSEVVPSINSIVSALNEAIPVSSISSSSGAIKCPSKKTFKVTVNGIDLGLCFSCSSGFTLYGNDLEITVEYLENHENIIKPTVDGECEKVASLTLMTSIGKSLFTGESMSSHDARRLKAASFNFDFSFGKDDSCSCKSTPRPCFFLHGLGIKIEEPENVDVFPTKYWGNLTDHAPCCSSMTYAVLNTVNNSWTDNEQQQKVCDRALSVNEASQGSAITDTIIVTHSMGNLMLAGAIATGKCSIGSSSTWVGLCHGFKTRRKGSREPVQQCKMTGTAYHETGEASEPRDDR